MLGTRMILFVGLCGLALIFQAFSECRRRDFGKDEPRVITAAEAIEKGPADNAHVVVTDFVLSDEYFEVTNNDHATNWIPVTAMETARAFYENARDPSQGGLPRQDLRFKPRSFRMIVKVPADDAKMLDAYTRENLQGMLLASIHTVDAGTIKAFRKTFPAVDMKGIRVLELDAKPAGFLKIGGYVLAGLAVMGLAGFLGVKRAEKSGVH